MIKCRDFYYININEENNEIFTCGAEFVEFMEYITVKPKNILLMQGQFWAGKLHNHTFFEYADDDNMNELLCDDVYSYGNFCWVDFSDKNGIDMITPEELAELLYMSHKFQPLKTPFIERLNNTYAYLAHDDSYWTRIYMKSIEDYMNVIEGKIIREMKGRRKKVEPIPKEILKYLFDSAKEGILIDFPSIYRHNARVGVRIYKIGKHINYDKIHAVLDRKYNCLTNDIILEYNNKKWKQYKEWK